METKALPAAIPTAAMSHTAEAQSPPGSDRYLRGLEALEKVDGEVGVKVVEMLARSFPDFATYIVEYPFGDIYSRPGLGLRERELAVVAALTAMGNAGPQLRVHIDAALHVGCTATEIVEVVMQMSVYAGFPSSLNGLAAVREVFAGRGIALPLATRMPAPKINSREEQQ